MSAFDDEKMKDFPEATIQPSKDIGEVENHGPRQHTKRGLKSRQVQFLALGGAIGTGLFIGTGATLSKVGPGKSPLRYGQRIVDADCRSTITYGIHRDVFW